MVKYLYGIPSSNSFKITFSTSHCLPDHHVIRVYFYQYAEGKIFVRAFDRLTMAVFACFPLFSAHVINITVPR